MSRLQIVEEAFLKAHKAGDKKNAQVLANEVRRLRQSQPAEPETLQPTEDAQTLAAPAPQATIQPDTSGFDAAAYKEKMRQRLGPATFTDRMIDTALFGFSDEVGAFPGLIMDKIKGEKGTPRYDALLELERERLKRYGSENQGLALGADVIGGLASAPVGAAKMAVPVLQRIAPSIFGKQAATKAAPVAQSMVRPVSSQLGKATLAGAGYGGLQGFGRGEGGVTPRLKQSAIGAGMGALGGAASVPLMRGISNVANRIGQAAQRRRETGRFGGGADERTLAKLLRRTGDPEDTVAQAQAAGMLDDTKAIVADLAPSLRQDLQALTAQQPTIRNLVTQTLDDRAAGQVGRLEDIVQRRFGPDDSYLKGKQLAASRQRTAAKLYENAGVNNLADPPLIKGKVVSQLLKEPRIKNALKRAKMLNKYKGVKPNTAPMLDKVYKTLGDQRTVALRKGDNDLANDYLLLQKRVSEALGPKYKKAINTFAGDKELERALADGQKAFQNKTITEELKDKLRGYTSGEKELFVQGFGNALIDKVLTRAGQGDRTKAIFNNEKQKRLIASVFGFSKKGKESFRKFVKTLEREIEMSKTKNVVLGGSQTQPNLANQRNLLGDAAIDLTTGTGTASLLGQTLKRLNPMGPSFAQQQRMANILMQPASIAGPMLQRTVAPRMMPPQSMTEFPLGGIGIPIGFTAGMQTRGGNPQQ
jgi:hypothetical protein